MKKFSILFGSFILGCAAVGAVEAGNGSHGGGPKPAKPTVVVEQDVVVEPGVVVKESVEVNGDSVTVTEEVDVGAPVGGPLSVGTVRKDARREKRATIAEAQAERRAGRFAKKAYNADHEAEAQAAVKRAYSN